MKMIRGGKVGFKRGKGLCIYIFSSLKGGWSEVFGRAGRVFNFPCLYILFPPFLAGFTVKKKKWNDTSICVGEVNKKMKKSKT